MQNSSISWHSGTKTIQQLYKHVKFRNSVNSFTKFINTLSVSAIFSPRVSKLDRKRKFRNKGDYRKLSSADDDEPNAEWRNYKYLKIIKRVFPGINCRRTADQLWSSPLILTSLGSAWDANHLLTWPPQEGFFNYDRKNSERLIFTALNASLPRVSIATRKEREAFSDTGN